MLIGGFRIVSVVKGDSGGVLGVLGIAICGCSCFAVVMGGSGVAIGGLDLVSVVLGSSGCLWSGYRWF